MSYAPSFILKKIQAVRMPRWDILLLIVLVASALAHSINMFDFPSYREDEGTYMSQATAVIEEQKLAQYTYWYDHAPGGWLFLALWQIMAGNLLTTDLSVDAGRIFMAVLQVASTYLVYATVRNVTKRKDAAFIAGLLFALTPLGIIAHRRLLLDNMMVFWFLLSLLFLTLPARLKYTMISALALAFAILTKESAVAFIPAMIALVLLTAHENHRVFAVVTWCSVTLLTVSLYPVFALLAGEFFPAGSWLGGEQPHVSLVEALQFHLGRDGGRFWEAGSTFQVALREQWLRYGPVFVIAGAFMTLIHILSLKRKWAFGIAALSVSYILFIIRGQVLDWYIIPLVPLFAISLAFGYDALVKRYRLREMTALPVQAGLMGLTVVILIVGLWSHGYIFTLDQTKNQVQAVSWVKDNIPADQVVLIDNYAFVDLNKGVSDITKTNIHYYWKADTDPIVKYDILGNNWNSIDYILFTPALTRSIYGDDLALVREAYEKSYVVKRFNAYDTLNEGYPVEIREVNNNMSTIRQSWRAYKDGFITAEGRVVDKSAANQTTSEGQSYALLRAVWEDDRETFDRVLNWTMREMKIPDAYLFAWLAGTTPDGTLAIQDYMTAADADEDIALALLFAQKKWNTPAYQTLAERIIADIWEHEVVEIQGTYYLTASADAKRGDGYLLNPSYFSPASYRIFAEVDPSHDWTKLASDVYVILDDINDSPVFRNQGTRLIPNWLMVNSDGTYATSNNHVNAEADLYGYDAFRLYWRLALDATWFKNEQAIEQLEAVTPFFKQEWYQKNQISALYRLDGTPASSYEDTSTNAGALAVFYITEPELAIELYSDKFWPEFKDGHWGEQNKYYSQNWGWFASALYANNVPDLWHTPSGLAQR